MSDRSPVDTPLVSFDQQQLSPTVTTPTKQQKTNDFFENYSSKEADLFGNHNGNGADTQEYHSNNGTNQDEHHNGTNGSNDEEFNQFSLNNNLFPVDTNENENEKGKLTLEIKT
jgi:hypothetical protein